MRLHTIDAVAEMVLWRDDVREAFCRLYETRQDWMYDKWYAKFYREAVDLGFPMAQFDLGQMCGSDYEKAFAWFKMSADQGYASAQNSLGDCYYEGKGVEQDYRKAIEWYQKAAGQGYDEAQYHLGDCIITEKASNKTMEKPSPGIGKGWNVNLQTLGQPISWANVIVTVPASNKIVNKL